MPRQCPQCGTRWTKNDRFCGECGADLQNPLQPESGDKPRRPPAALVWVLELIPGIMRPMVIVMSIVGVLVAGAAFWMASFLFTMGGLLSAFSIGGAGMILYWTAWSWLLYGYICNPVEAMAEFQSRHWVALFLATVVPGSLLLCAMKIAAGS